jgi:hypothetical protein
MRPPMRARSRQSHGRSTRKAPEECAKGERKSTKNAGPARRSPDKGGGRKKTGRAKGPSRLKTEEANVQSSWMSSLMSDVTRLMISLASATICRGS